MRIIMRLLLIIPLLGCTLVSQSQSHTIQPWYFGAGSGVQINFGPSSSDPMITGGKDTSFNRIYSFRPGFKMSVPVEIETGYSGFKNYSLELGIRYYRVQIGLIEELYKNEFDLVWLDAISFKLSGFLVMGSKSEEKPNGLLLGLSAKGSAPFNVQHQTKTSELFGIKNFEPSLQFNFTLDSKFHYYLYKNVLFLNAGISIDLPTSILEVWGDMGSVELNSNSKYTLKNGSVKMHSFSGSLGLGYRLGNRIKEPSSK